MRITVTVKPGAKRAAVAPSPDGSFVVSVSAPAKEGRANAAVERALAEHLGIASSRVFIVAGKTSRKKIVEIIK